MTRVNSGTHGDFGFSHQPYGNQGKSFQAETVLILRIRLWIKAGSTQTFHCLLAFYLKKEGRERTIGVVIKVFAYREKPVLGPALRARSVGEDTGMFKLLYHVCRDNSSSGGKRHTCRCFSLGRE